MAVGFSVKGVVPIVMIGEGAGGGTAEAWG